MLVKIFCPNRRCAASLNVDTSDLGRTVRCGSCGTKFVARAGGSRTPSTVGQPEAPVDPTLNLPPMFGRYQILQLLGHGGMGAVYLARDGSLRRDVALKVPSLADRAQDAALRRRFDREARAAASVHHPNLCTIYEVGEVNGRPYMTMAYMPGGTLAEKVDRARPMDPREAADLVGKVALALAEAHDKGVVHGDLKPSNIMIDRRGEPVVMDFGLGRMDAGAEAEVTGPGATLGTADYMSPERVKGDQQAIGPATDVYSLGAILYELVTGRRPFEGPRHSVLEGILAAEPPPPTDHRPGLDPPLVRIIQSAMVKSLDARYRSMRPFAQAIDGYLRDSDGRRRDAPPSAVRAVPAVPLRKVSMRWRIALVAVAAVFTLGIALAALFNWGRGIRP